MLWFTLSASANKVLPTEVTNNQHSEDSDTISYPILHIEESDNTKLMSSLSFETLKKNLQAQITQAKRKKQPIEALEQQMSKCEAGLSALRATNKVVFIDSVVVGKSEFLKAYKFDKELGNITLSADKQSTSYTTELGTLIYKTELDANNKLTINSYFVEDGKLVLCSKLSDLEFDNDINYPFLLTDGSTLYFASRNEEGLGNYDIYVTRYDAEDRTYLTPTNLGYPFNSYANDYLMVIDEDLGIGWFASDRYQSPDNVCIYTFIQPKARHTYDYETDDRTTIINAARINSIKDTWRGNEDDVRSARQALTLKQNQSDVNTQHDFDFVINNNYTYHSLSDFKNNNAKREFTVYQQKKAELEQIESTLSQLRTQAHGSTIREQILRLEQQVSILSHDLTNRAKEIRKLELQ